jgi:hypothetical protein
MKLNMGCGNNKFPGFVNVDQAPECSPDVIWNLEDFPWPWDENSIDEVLFHHSLEHLGESPRMFLQIMKELYRICRNGATIQVNVPHPRHDNFLNDPTHVRPISPQMLSLFDRALNEHWQRTNSANSPLAVYTGVDFSIKHVNSILAEPYATQYQEKRLDADALTAMERELNNVIAEYQITMVARKE